MYAERFYRSWVNAAGLCRFEVAIGQSDLLVLCDREARADAGEHLAAARRDIETTIAANPTFATALEPVAVAPDAPDIVLRMARAARSFDVGPMAAVAGAVAEHVGRGLLRSGAEAVVIENGGDVYARVSEPLRLALYAGEESPFRDRLAFTVDARGGLGVCTSSGRVGPSLSFGHADAVVAIAPETAVADAAATAIANRVRGPDDVADVVSDERAHGGLSGLIVCCGDRLGAWGGLELSRR